MSYGVLVTACWRSHILFGVINYPSSSDAGSTFPSAEDWRTNRLVCWFLLGKLKGLLGKPGTLHFLGHITVLAWGVPPDPRDASAFYEGS